MNYKKLILNNNRYKLNKLPYGKGDWEFYTVHGAGPIPSDKKIRYVKDLTVISCGPKGSSIVEIMFMENNTLGVSNRPTPGNAENLLEGEIS